jgi:hypothetical protein
MPPALWPVARTDWFPGSRSAGAFRDTLADGHKVRFLSSYDPAQVLGAPLVLKEDGKGLFGGFKISRMPFGEQVRTHQTDGALDSFSVGYRSFQVQAGRSSSRGSARGAPSCPGSLAHPVPSHGRPGRFLRSESSRSYRRRFRNTSAR